MKTIQFKTNIKCGNCVAQVTPHLDAVAGIGKWEVDLQHPGRILSVEADSATARQVQEAVQKAGFKAEAV